MVNYCDFNELLGKTIINIKGLEEGNDEVYFYCSDGTKYEMFHYQDCCESVCVEDVCGDAENLLNTPITMAEEITNLDIPPKSEWDESYTWTYYKLATIKGYVTIRWYGESNGYYSEGVDFRQLKE